MSISIKRRAQLGSALTDVLVAVAILSIMMTLFIGYQVDESKRLRAKKTGDNITQVTEYFRHYLVSHKGDSTTPKIIQAMIDGTNANQWCVINANPSTGVGTTANNTSLHTCAVDISFLKYKNIIPSSYPETNSFGHRWTAIFKLVYADYDNNPATPLTTNGSIEMLVVGAVNGGNEIPMESADAAFAAQIAGFNGGFIPNGQWGNCHYDAGAKQACSPGQSWKVDLSDFLNTP